jgi:predicted MFS family arabinose efflux permease
VWLEQSFGLKLAALGAASAVIGISEISGESIGGFLSDKLGRERSIKLGMGGMLLVTLLLPFAGGSQAAAMVGLFLFYLTYEFTFISTVPFMTDLVPGARGTLLGVNVACLSLGRLIGNVISAFVFRVGFWLNALSAGIIILISFWALTRAIAKRNS